MITTAENLSGLAEYLNRKVMGQVEAITKTREALASAQNNLNDTGPRPKGSFLFMGPTGVGKTSLAKALCAHLFGHENLSMIFMNEMTSPLSAPAVAVAIQAGIRRCPDGTVLLFDEIEKAHKTVIDLFLSLLEEGEITMSSGERIGISNCYVIMTSNIGAEKWPQMRKMKYTRMHQFAKDEANRILRRELVGRINEIVVFRPLGAEVQLEIMKDAMQKKISHLKHQFGSLSFDQSCRPYLLRACFSQSGGARTLKNELDRQVNSALIPWTETSRKPRERIFYYEPGVQRLVLR